VWVDDLKIELHFIGGAAHTTNDVVAWIPERGVLFTGDLVFNGGTPFPRGGLREERDARVGAEPLFLPDPGQHHPHADREDE
jgi:glyoxylase-like metal-dependent hydrolase (beta-lactamase superfamily II)